MFLVLNYMCNTLITFILLNGAEFVPKFSSRMLVFSQKCLDWIRPLKDERWTYLGVVRFRLFEVLTKVSRVADYSPAYPRSNVKCWLKFPFFIENQGSFTVHHCPNLGGFWSILLQSSHFLIYEEHWNNKSS